MKASRTIIMAVKSRPPPSRAGGLGFGGCCESMLGKEKEDCGLLGTGDITLCSSIISSLKLCLPTKASLVSHCPFFAKFFKPKYKFGKIIILII